MAAVKNLNSSVLKEFDEVSYAKVVLMGSIAVGKTSLVTRFCRDKFNHNQPSTVYVDFATVKVTLPEMKKPLVLQIWDTVGQERYSAVNVSFLRRSSAAVVVYNVTDKESFYKTCRFINDVERIVPEALVVIVGNKDDLEQNRVVSIEEGEIMAKDFGYEFMETSALTGHNVDNLFHNIARTLSKKNKEKKEESIKLNSSATKRRACCKS